MDDSSASTSADPLVLPSSPLVRHNSPRKPATKPLRSRSPAKQQFSSPAKSFIMDTGDGANDQSPWRIKVTVQAEPRDGSSPSKKPFTKTTTVPLKGGSSSPAKRPVRRKKVAELEESEMDVEIKRPQRKRKGTPMKRAPRRGTPARVAEEEAVEGPTLEEQENAVASSPAKKRAKRSGRHSLGIVPTQRGQRLSQAREELDEALQEAVGPNNQGEEDGDEEDMLVSEGMQGDMTAMNEDFTMISVETLQSMKQSTSMLEDSQIGEKSAVNGSYWPSSPPENQRSAKRSGQRQMDGTNVDYPNISAQAQYARDTPAKSFVQAFDAMSWKSTGRTAQEPTPAESSELQHSSGKKQAAAAHEERWQQERKDVSEKIAKAPREEVVTVEDEPDAELGAEEFNDEDDQGQQQEAADDDIWADEASRSLEEDIDVSHLAHRSRQAPQQQKPTTADNINDLFCGLSSKPPRAKIPRTWRRSSGMDFQYSDSPAHSFAAPEEETGEKHNVAESEEEDEEEDEAADEDDGEEADEAADEDDGEEAEGEEERGSGVLTPPSTDEDEAGDEVGEDEQMEDAEAEDEDEEEGASKSVFEPDAAATELQVRHAHDADSQSEDEEDESAPGPAENDDTGVFWQRNRPHRNLSMRPVRPQRKARDLSSLLKDDESSRIEKEPSPKASKAASVLKSQVAQPAQPVKRFPGSRLLAARREAASSSFTSTSSGDQTIEVKKIVVNEPLRKSMLRGSLDNSAAVSKTLAIPAARQRLVVRSTELTRQQQVNESIGDTSLSFASKASDQRQLLGETVAATPAVKPRRKVGSRVEVAAAEVEDESLWQAAGRSEEDVEENDEAEEDGEDVSSPAQDVNYSSSPNGTQYTDDYVSESKEQEDEETEVSGRSIDATRSYEENLNISSPQKIRVKFGDSSTVGNSSLLQPRRNCPPLFEQQRPPSRGHQNPYSHSTQTQLGHTEPGLFSKLTTSLWTAATTIIRPSGPIVEPVFPPSLRTQLRSRYGVLSSQHHWTMAHMRTLHRMMNSCTTGKADSLVPRPGGMDLPSSLLPMVGRNMKDPGGRPFVLTPQLALVVYAFLQLLVPAPLIQQIEVGEIDFIGDSMALACRNYFDSFNGKPRHGSDLVFEDKDLTALGKKRPKAEEAIGVDWVVRCIGACVWAQNEWEEREG